MLNVKLTKCVVFEKSQLLHRIRHFALGRSSYKVVILVKANSTLQSYVSAEVAE